MQEEEQKRIHMMESQRNEWEELSDYENMIDEQ